MMGDRRDLPASTPQKFCLVYEENLYIAPDFVSETFYTHFSWDWKTYPHSLIIGSTGTGKTTALKRLVLSLMKENPQCEIFLCSFKHKDDDFPYLSESSHFASFSRCRELFETFFNRYLERVNGDDFHRYPLRLVFDEWAGFILAQPKNEQDELLRRLGLILMTGRSVGVQVVIAMQRPDAVFFKYGARDNFGLILSLGNLTSDGASMVYPSQYLKRLTPCTIIGQGHVLIGGGVKFCRVRIPPVNKACDLLLKHKLSD